MNYDFFPAEGLFCDLTVESVTMATSATPEGLITKEKGRFVALNLANESGHTGQVIGNEVFPFPGLAIRSQTT
jgi:hypothetical protein